METLFKSDGVALWEENTNIFLTECKESKACAPAKHHFDECVERVTGADHGKPVDKKHPDEDCVEECKSRIITSPGNDADLGVQSSTWRTAQGNVQHLNSGLPSSRVATLSINKLASKIFS